MRQYKYCIQALVFIIFSFAVYTCSAFGQNENFKLELINNKLSIYAQEIPLGTLLKEIENRTGIQFIIGEEELKRTFSGNLQSLPLNEAFNIIFQKIDHIVFYNSEGKILTVKTVNKGIVPSVKLNTGINKLQREDKITVPHGEDDMNVTYDADNMDVL
jgi:type II secretory pathway component GspD/PulD (secretin)